MDHEDRIDYEGNVKMSNYVTVLPNAASLIESMRSIGYSFETAIADIIDNSISANANIISIFNRKYNGTPYVQIIDDGNGMSDVELLEAMRLGSKNPNEVRHRDDLGRFGLGLKSASFSQCKILTVISKKSGIMNGYQWNLDFVQKYNKFEVKKLSENELENFINISELSGYKSGTIVHWENFDRLSSSSINVEEELSNLLNISIEHISLIFHRYIEEGLNINVNYNEVIPKDPFLTKHAGTQELITKKVKIENEEIYLYPYVLPHFSKLSATDQRKSGKVKEYYKSQGFYLYRNKRLIVWGDYLGLARKSELGKNVRIKVDIPNNLDYIWEIDVKKSRANVPSKIKSNLLSAINDGDIVSKRLNTFRGTREIKNEQPIWMLTSGRDDSFFLDINEKNDIYIQFEKTLDEEQKTLFNIFKKVLSANIPSHAIYAQISGGTENKVPESDVVDELNTTLKELRKANILDIKLWLKSLLHVEPYKSDAGAIDFINKEINV